MPQSYRTQVRPTSGLTYSSAMIMVSQLIQANANPNHSLLNSKNNQRRLCLGI